MQTELFQEYRMFVASEMIEEKTLLQSDRSIRITLLVDCIFVFAHHD